MVTAIGGSGTPVGALLLLGALMLLSWRALRYQADLVPVAIVLSNPVPPG